MIITYLLYIPFSFLVPSSSGLATLSMPIIAPLADFSGVARHLVVTAFQSANGLVNLITPTSAVVMGGLAIGKIPFERWIKYVCHQFNNNLAFNMADVKFITSLAGLACTFAVRFE